MRHVWWEVLRQMAYSLTFYQCCGSGMFIPDPGSWFLRIPDPGSRIPDPGSRIQKQLKKRGVEKICCRTFLCSHKFHKIVNYFSFAVLKKKIWASFQRIIELVPKKLSLSSQKYGFGIRDPGSGKNLFRIPDPGVKKAPDPGSGSATLLFTRFLIHRKIHLLSLRL
jgi:hypothetical protein